MKCLIFFYFLIYVMGKIYVSSLNTNSMDLDDPEIDFRIIGGSEALPHQFPYQVALVMKYGKYQQFCGGSLISNEYVLTAAHCVDNVTDVNVILGAHNLYKNETTKRRYKVEDYFIHENWSTDTLTGDIAVLKLPEKIQFDAAIQPVRLPKYSKVGKSLYGRTVIVSGWGRTSDKVNKLSPVLRYIKTRVISQLWCKIAFLGLPSAYHVCISGLRKKSICGGDSGGPLVTVEKSGEPTLHGIASFGFGLGCERMWPAVFTRVTSYLDWIHDHTGIDIDK